MTDGRLWATVRIGDRWARCWVIHEQYKMRSGMGGWDYRKPMWMEVSSCE